MKLEKHSPQRTQRKNKNVGALMFIAIVALVGAFSYIFIVGDIRRIELEQLP